MNKNAIVNELLISEDVIEEIFHLYFDELSQFLGYYSRDVQLIEDCLQDVFVKLWEDRANINIFHIKTYLYKAARNRVWNALRNAQNRLAHQEIWFKEEMAREYAEECVNMEEFAMYYNEAVETLPEKCRMVYRYCKDARKTYKQVADELQLSVKTVENQMSIAYKKIRTHIIARYHGGSPSTLVWLMALSGTIVTS